MYTLLIAFACGVGAALFWAIVLFPGAFIVGPLMGLLVSLIVLAVLSRRLLKKIQPKFAEAQKLAQTNQLNRAVESLESLRPYGPWQLMLEGQIDAQIGMLLYHENEDRAYDHLLKASTRMPDAFLLRAAIEYRRGEEEKARATCEQGIRTNKKYAMLYHFLAWLHHKGGDDTAALQVLGRAQQAEKENEATKGNIHRLQNGQRMDMRQFGDMWYLLKIERPPATSGMMTVRKGFRQPKGTGKKPRRKR
ncbi:MAG: hypothetical protein KDC38_06090 [Planctomycetes bacterium]|nr:hypothetical protein [Planctomycetota bacterium]